MTRALAASLAGADRGPGRGTTKKSRRPARKSRAADSSLVVVYPKRAAA
jgi:hypothetical protein